MDFDLHNLLQDHNKSMEEPTDHDTYPAQQNLQDSPPNLIGSSSTLSPEDMETQQELFRDCPRTEAELQEYLRNWKPDPTPPGVSVEDWEAGTLAGFMREEQKKMLEEEKLAINTPSDQSINGVDLTFRPATPNRTMGFDNGSNMAGIVADTFSVVEPSDHVHPSQMYNNGPFEDVLEFPGMNSKPRYTTLPTSINNIQGQVPIDPQLLAMDAQQTPYPMRYTSPEEALSSPVSNADYTSDTDMMDASFDEDLDLSSIGIRWDGTQAKWESTVKQEAEKVVGYPGEDLMGYQRVHLSFEMQPQRPREPEILSVNFINSDGQVEKGMPFVPEAMQEDDDYARFAPIWDRRNGYSGSQAYVRQVGAESEVNLVAQNAAESVAPATDTTLHAAAASQHLQQNIQPQPNMAPKSTKEDPDDGQFVAPVARMMAPQSLSPYQHVPQMVPPHTASPYHSHQQFAQGWQGALSQDQPVQYMGSPPQTVQGYADPFYQITGQAPPMHQPALPVPQHTPNWQGFPQAGQPQGQMVFQPMAPSYPPQQGMQGITIPPVLQSYMQYPPPPARTFAPHPPSPPTAAKLLGTKCGGYYRKFPISFGHQRILTTNAVELAAAEKRMPAKEIPLTLDSDVKRYFKWHHSGTKKFDALVSFSPPLNVDLRLLGNLRVTAAELLTFFPNHIRWHDYIFRLRQNGWSNKHVAGYLNYARQLSGDDAKKMTWVQQAVREADESILGFKGTKERPLTNRPAFRTTGFSCVNWTPYPKLQGNDAILVDYYLVDLVDGVVNMPEGNGARLLTRAVRFAVDHNHRYVKMSQIPEFLQEWPEIVEPMLKPMACMGLDANEENPDYALVEELREMIDKDVERVGTKSWRPRKGTMTGLEMPGAKEEDED
ncbi:hypothetical protein K491DRAFT_721515 [Lophiostoma macrostomum CBS 122681]|uniref:Uncharacterized protein n=1 Tax=Lophiostoma macrostomum CBS 122681 TaxID=1314788 RepID=A0A6A6SP54_9PLEO|nr:hypothetical protein K491DRAFT_721515 [Lophiostoma macrostomum CBS 122681]